MAKQFIGLGTLGGRGGLTASSSTCKNYTNGSGKAVSCAYCPDVRSMGVFVCLFVFNEFPPGVVIEE